MPPAPIRGGKQPPPPPASAFAFVAPAEPAAQPEPASPEFKAIEPAAASPALSGAPTPEPLRAVPSYVATLPIFVGGARGTVPVGAPYKPTDDAERLLLLSQNAIREA